MEIEIVSESDDNFKITTKKFGEVAVATDGERVSIGTDEKSAKEGVEEMQVLAKIRAKIPAPIENRVIETPSEGPRPAPIENPKGLDWFKGTSWGS